MEWYLVPAAAFVWVALFRALSVQPPYFLKPSRLGGIGAWVFGACVVALGAVLEYGKALNPVIDELAGIQWLATGVLLFSWLGISLRDDVIERGNRAAELALGGAMAGVTACFAGACLGGSTDLKEILTNAGLASAALGAVWVFADWAGSHWVDAITIDRDPGAGLRFGGLLAAVGLGLGSAATSPWNLLTHGWTILPSVCLAAVVERSLRSTRESARSGWLAISYVVLTGIAIAMERYIR